MHRVLQAFWFYRPREIPNAAWRTHKRLKGHIEGRALCKLTPKSKPFTEQFSEKQVGQYRRPTARHTLHFMRYVLQLCVGMHAPSHCQCVLPRAVV